MLKISYFEAVTTMYLYIAPKVVILFQKDFNSKL